MTNRMFKKIAMACAAMAVFGYSQSCKKVTLYSGSEEGSMEESTRTFPEQPEWKANWGNFGKMVPPYIRLSGQKASKGDWTGALLFPTDVNVAGGTLSMDVRATQGVKFGVWIGTRGEGKTFYKNLAPNETYSLEIPVAQLGVQAPFTLDKINIGLFGMGAYQYTTLFVDNIAVSCAAGAGGTAAGSTAASSTGTTQAAAVTDFIVGGEASSPTRPQLWDGEPMPQTSLRYTPEEQDSLRQRTQAAFALEWEDHDRILRFLQNDTLSPKESREGWYKALYLVTNHRLRDSVIANPKQLFADANGIAAMNEMRSFPLLVANLDYSYSTCTDTLCNSTVIEDYRLLAAGFPTSYTRGSKIRITYDPFFVTTDKHDLPSIEICTGSTCKQVEPGKATDIEFTSAGIQKLVVKLAYGATKVQQTLSLEVR